MAKTSVKARELKRQKMVKKFAEKRATLKAAGDWAGSTSYPRILRKFACTTGASSQVVPAVTCGTSVCQG